MSWVSFSAWQFAAAGAVCAAGPIIIHLLNRRRYRVVKWAAMDFLRQAMKRNRRILQIRDLILLVLRTVAVLLFGAALARPYFARRQEQFDDRQPLHAVIVIDNSLSMAYESLEGSLLDKAKDRARQLIERLPAGSRVSLIPACGARESWSSDPFETKDAVYEALARIEVVDRSATIARVANEARRACDDVPELAKRVVFISDQQELNWRDARQNELLKDLPPMQVVAVGAAEWENTWIADLRVQDGLADVETPATIVVELAHRGQSPRRDLEVTLTLGETVIGQKTVTVEPGLGTRQVDFEYVFSTLSELPEPGKPVFVPLSARIATDRLAADDQRFLAVPVVAALPVVFVDQYGPDQEDVVRGRLGETRHLRKLLAPKTSRSDAPRQLISVRHGTPGELSREVLADARLVVVAGLREPGEIAPLLADYVRQGGQLVLAAGAEFDPAAWNDTAWLDGQGILPLPLAPEPIGQTPEAASENLKPFFLSQESLTAEGYFQLAGVAPSDLKDLYAEPFFFKAVKVDALPPTLDALKQAEMKRLEERPEEPSTAWLLWATGEANESELEPLPKEPMLRASRLEALAAAHAPRILARFELPAQPPFLVARRIGRGEVLFCSTGLLSPWNTLPKTNAVLIFDRILRDMIQNTLPRRNIEPADQYVLPLPHEEQNLLVTLTRPGQSVTQPLDVSYIGAQHRGVTLTGLLQRGVYRVSGFRPALSSDQGLAAQARAWDVPLVVGGSSEESDLTPLARSQFDDVANQANVCWVGAGEEISLAGAAIRGQNSWWWLVLAVLLLLLVEMSVLVWPTFQTVEPPPIRATLA
jgi:aerotolerance regulator-like protein/VWA domain-containing protein